MQPDSCTSPIQLVAQCGRVADDALFQSRSEGAAPVTELTLAMEEISFRKSLEDFGTSSFQQLDGYRYGEREDSTDDSGNEHGLDHSDTDKGTEDEHPRAWPTRTPTPSPPQTPRQRFTVRTGTFIPPPSARGISRKVNASSSSQSSDYLDTFNNISAMVPVTDTMPAAVVAMVIPAGKVPAAVPALVPMTGTMPAPVVSPMAGTMLAPVVSLAPLAGSVPIRATGVAPISDAMPASYSTQVCPLMPASAPPPGQLFVPATSAVSDENCVVFQGHAPFIPAIPPPAAPGSAALLAPVAPYPLGNYGNSAAVPVSMTMPAGECGVMAVMDDTVPSNHASSDREENLPGSEAALERASGTMIPLVPPGVNTRHPTMPPGVFNFDNIPDRLVFGNLHRLHVETSTMGSLSEDCRRFSKTQFHGRLSLVTEDQIQTSGIHRYLVQFSEGELSSADGVGFVFSSTLPCSKNIQRISSIFVNRAGRICMRARSSVQRSDVGIKRLELGEWIEMIVNLDERTAKFSVWTPHGMRVSTACFAFGSIFGSLSDTYQPRRGRSGGSNANGALAASGHFACLVKHEGVHVTLGS